MAEYQITIKPSAVKELDGLPATVASRVAAKIKALAATPRPPGVKKLEESPFDGEFAPAIGASSTRSMTKPASSTSSTSATAARPTIDETSAETHAE